MSTTVWEYLSLSDRETFVSGILAWLLDPGADHGLGPRVLRRVASRLGIQVPENGRIGVKAEARARRNRRFDVLVTVDGKHWLVLELKAKTSGGRSQLQNYSEVVEHVARVAFGEWNFPSLTDDDRQRFPLVRFDELADELAAFAEGAERYGDLIAGVSRHLKLESAAFAGIREFYLTEEADQPPKSDLGLTLGTRFVNHLFWKWFSTSVDTKYAGDRGDWEVKSERSGVWCAGPYVSIDATEALVFPHIGLRLEGPLKVWIHLELVGSLFGDMDEQVAWAQLRVTGESSGEHRQRVYAKFVSNHDELASRGWDLPRRAPSDGSYYYNAMSKALTRRELRASSLVELIDRELAFRRTGAD